MRRPASDAACAELKDSSPLRLRCWWPHWWAARSPSCSDTAPTTNTIAPNANATAAATTREEADIDRLVAQAQADASEDPIRASLLAVEAWKRDPTWQTAGAVQSVLAQVPKGVLGHVFGDGGELGKPVIGRKVMVASNADKVMVWDATTGRLLRTIAVGAIVGNTVAIASGVVMTSDEKYVAASTPDRVSVFSVDSGERIAQLSMGADAIIAFDPTDGERLVAAATEGPLALVRWRTGQTIARATAPRPSSLQFSPDGTTIATGHIDGKVRLWNGDTLTPTSAGDLAVLPEGTPNAYSYTSEFSPDGSLVAGSALNWGAVRVFRVADGELIASIDLPPVPLLGSGAFMDNRTLLVQSDSVLRFDVTTQKEVLPKLTTGWQFIALNPDRTLMAAKSGNGIQFTALDSRQLGARASLALPASALPRFDEATLSMDRDGRQLLAYLSGDAAYLYDLRQPNALARAINLPGEGTLTRAEYTPSGTSILTTRRTSGYFVFQRWDPATLSPVGPPIRSLADTNCSCLFAISADDKLMAIGEVAFEGSTAKGIVNVFDMATGVRLHELTDIRTMGPAAQIALVWSLAFGADGARLAAGLGGTPLLVEWDLAQSPPKFSQFGPGALASNVAYDPASKWLSNVVTSDGTITLFDTATKAVQGEPLRGRAAAGQRWHPTEQFLMTGGKCGALGTARDLALWDIDNGVEIGKGFLLNCGTWFPDGKSFAGKDNTSVQVWDFDQRAWAVAACRFAGRELTAAEWERYGPRDAQRPTCHDL